MYLINRIDKRSQETTKARVRDVVFHEGRFSQRVRMMASEYHREVKACYSNKSARNACHGVLPSILSRDVRQFSSLRVSKTFRDPPRYIRAPRTRLRIVRSWSSYLRHLFPQRVSSPEFIPLVGNAGCSDLFAGIE